MIQNFLEGFSISPPKGAYTCMHGMKVCTRMRRVKCTKLSNIIQHEHRYPLCRLVWKMFNQSFNQNLDCTFSIWSTYSGSIAHTLLLSYLTDRPGIVPPYFSERRHKKGLVSVSLQQSATTSYVKNNPIRMCCKYGKLMQTDTRYGIEYANWYIVSEPSSVRRFHETSLCSSCCSQAYKSEQAFKMF